MEVKLPLARIVVADRMREELGDVEELAISIRDNGLLQPVVVEMDEEAGDFKLRAGGRRFAAFTLLATNKVPSADPTFYYSIPVRVFDQMPEHQRLKIELEENLRRKGMTWQETVLGICRYHKAAKRAALLDHEDWSQTATGELLNMSQANVSVALMVGKRILAGDKKIAHAESLNDALKAIASAELDSAQAELMKRIEAKRAVVTAQTTLPKIPSSIIVLSNENKPETVEDKIQITKEQIASFYHQGDCRLLLPRISAAGVKINHIVCDPPYGIDMANLGSDSVERIEATHQVEDNIGMLEEFLQVSYDTIENDGFLCMWYDLDHHEKIHAWATKIGWRVQRWPLVWCKTTPCRNSQAQYNITKSTEVCYLMRRSEQSILRNKRSNNFIEAAAVNSGSHPFVKPDAIWGTLLDLVSSVGDTVVDPFAGEGSSLAASFKRKRNPVGIELDPVHIASGLSYIQEQVNRKSLLEGMMISAPL